MQSETRNQDYTFAEVNAIADTTITCVIAGVTDKWIQWNETERVETAGSSLVRQRTESPRNK